MANDYSKEILHKKEIELLQLSAELKDQFDKELLVHIIIY